MRLQELRGTYGIKAPAPICADPRSALGDADSGDDPADLSDRPGAGRRRPAAGARRRRRPRGTVASRPDDEAEIRLTYRELSALIEDAIRNLR